jgi:hypothetical protein
VLTLTVLAYAGANSLYGGEREEMVVSILMPLVLDPGRWAQIVRFSLGQAAYVFTSTLGLFVMATLIGAWNLLRAEQPDEQARRRLVLFATVAAACFYGFAVIGTLVYRYDADPGFGFEHYFFIGRYGDPTAWLLTIAGASIVVGPNVLQGRWLRYLIFITPVLFALAIVPLSRIKFVPSVYCGLSILARYRAGEFPWLHVLVAVAVVSATVVAWGRFRRGTPFLLAFIAFHAFSVETGMRYTRARAMQVDHTLQAAKWLDQETEQDISVCYDWTISRERAPGGIKKMANVYRAMAFATYPRDFVALHTDPRDASCDFVYTARRRSTASDAATVWGNEDYVLLDVRAEDEANSGSEPLEAP